MANIYKNEKTSLTTTDLTTLYTVPSNSRAIVKSLLVTEDNAGAAVVKVTLVDAAAASFVVDNNVIILEAGDKIKMQCATGNVIKMTASVLQISRPTEVTTT